MSLIIDVTPLSTDLVASRLSRLIQLSGGLEVVSESYAVRLNLALFAKAELSIRS